MDLNPYVSGAMTAVIYLVAAHFLPKKIHGAMRVLLSIAVAVAVSCLIHFVIDCIVV